MPDNPVVEPKSVSVRMYQVGFGDCFLVTLTYTEPLDDGRDSRHILIDFGSTRVPRKGAKLVDVAELIASHCGGKLDVIVMTHRHKDHISGFGDSAGAEVIDGLAPSLVVRPWTEDPSLAEDAAGPDSSPESRSFVRRLRSAESAAERTAKALAEASSSHRGLMEEVSKLAADQVPNKEAIEQLDAWAQAGAAAFVSFGADSRIEEFVPGLSVRVLGPPTVEDWPEMAHQRVVDKEEFWMLRAMAVTKEAAIVAASERAGATSTGEQSAIPAGPISWLVDRLHRQSLHSLHRIVRALDDALNNTSVILLLEVGDKRLLFPGDAQIENWSYALKGPGATEEVLSALSEVDFYKVGHHGSRNATPKSLFNLWGADPDAGHPVVSFMSTLSGVHGTTDATRVPRATLVAALQHRTTLITTDGLEADQLFVEASGPVVGSEPLQVVEQ